MVWRFKGADGAERTEVGDFRSGGILVWRFKGERVQEARRRFGFGDFWAGGRCRRGNIRSRFGDSRVGEGEGGGVENLGRGG